MTVLRNNPKINPRPAQPHTSFQTQTGYLPENDIRTDAAIVYLPFTPVFDTSKVESWKAKGYVVQTMYGFRTGDDYIKEHPDEGQTDQNGRILVPMPGSYYMVPTQQRVDTAIEFFKKAIVSGSSAAIPEEPEFWARAGYSEAFKREWQAFYGEPWQDPSSSVTARYMAERLKGYLEYRIVKSSLEESHKQDPNVIGMVACHSQLSYYAWGIIHPHYQESQIPDLQEIIGQVWTGTARTPCKYEGTTAEHTFEFAYLEYSAFNNLLRGTGKRMWFLMDPLEDNPDPTMHDYQVNYEKTLVASLMFPEVDSYEVMPWPTRIYGRVSDEYATKVGSIINMLGDMHRQEDWELDSGTQGIATFVADSMAWQRTEPHPSNFDSFYGLTLPLFMKGIPIQVAQLERTPEPGYLTAYKVLLLSYDMMKPMDPTYNAAIAEWVRKGGTLILFGGTDPYDNVPEWWHEARFQSPQDHLLTQLGVTLSNNISLTCESEFVTLLTETCPSLETEQTEPRVLDLTYALHLKKPEFLPNRKRYKIDLSPYILPDGHVFVKFENACKDGGWAPHVFGLELLVDGLPMASFAPGSVEERKHIVDDHGSQLDESARFADTDSWWIYEFQTPIGSRVELVVDMQNTFRVSVSTSSLGDANHLQSLVENFLTKAYPQIDVPVVNEITAYETDAKGLYNLNETNYSPFFEASVGDGTLIFVGIAPKYFASSPQSAELLRAITAYGCDKAGLAYKEQGYIKIHRGRYIAVHSFDQPVELNGSFIDILDPKLPILNNPVVPAGGLAVMADVGVMLSDSKPQILLASDRIEASSEKASTTRLLLTGPLKTKGVVRISSAGKSLHSVLALNADEAPVPTEYKMEQSTLFIKYDSLPEGVMLIIEWQ